MGKVSKMNYEIKEILGVASAQEDLKSDWCKAVITTLMTDSNGDDVEGVDIRRINIDNHSMGHGVRFTPIEANNVTNILLENGYGNFEVLEKEYLKRKALFEGCSENVPE